MADINININMSKYWLGRLISKALRLKKGWYYRRSFTFVYSPILIIAGLLLLCFALQYHPKLH